MYVRACETLERGKTKVDPTAQQQKAETEKRIIETLRASNLTFYALTQQGPWLELEHRVSDIKMTDPGVLAAIYVNFMSDPNIVAAVNRMPTQQERGVAFEGYVRDQVERKGNATYGLRKCTKEPLALKIAQISGAAV